MQVDTNKVTPRQSHIVFARLGRGAIKDRPKKRIIVGLSAHAIEIALRKHITNPATCRTIAAEVHIAALAAMEDGTARKLTEDRIKEEEQRRIDAAPPGRALSGLSIGDIASARVPPASTQTPPLFTCTK